MLFADDAAVTVASLMGHFSKTCKEFGLTISLKKTNVLGKRTEAPSVVTIDGYLLEVVCDFTNPGSIIMDNRSRDKIIYKRTGKTATTLAGLTTGVWTNPKLTVETKTKPVLSAHCYTAARRGTRMPSKRGSWTLLIWEASTASWANASSTMWPTLKSISVASPVYSISSDNARYAGWAMSTASGMAASKKTFCKESWHLRRDTLAIPIQRFRKKRHRHWHRVLWKPCRRQVKIGKDPEKTCEVRGREAC